MPGVRASARACFLRKSPFAKERTPPLLAADVPCNMQHPSAVQAAPLPRCLNTTAPRPLRWPTMRCPGTAVELTTRVDEYGATTRTLRHAPIAESLPSRWRGGSTLHGLPT